ncbi:PLP-dependent aminotransferase family protein [Steroidobacter cummioxidans]|uniref:aminotransferase-like domain-containing protein n=1 Tax=Steroidobacter cummioxidans TaxID=1803913 RepID=UPI000E310121|nr:PLP-dependent aminotransferase family protein [Steroidobacter cummioxidans]
MKLYQELAADITSLIQQGTLQAGERIPSVRELCRERGVSPATAMRAYDVLEANGLVESRHRSGYFVSNRWQQTPNEPRASRPSSRTTQVDVSDLVFNILEASRDRDVVPLGSAFPSPTLFPWAKLARHLGSSARNMDPWSTVESLPPGSPELRRQIARRYLQFGSRVPADEIVVTSGALEALTLCLQTVTRPGDTVAIEAPAFYACLQAIETWGLRAVEIPTHPREGIDLGALEQAIVKHNVRACWVMTTFQNPLGASLPEEEKKEKRDLVQLLAEHEIPLIEDDVYAELHFDQHRPKPAKAFDRKGLVLNCGSFSKSLAPGYRLGWTAAGRFAPAVQRRKVTTSLATSVPIQNGIAQMLRNEGYDRHLDKLRQALRSQQGTALASIKQHFPSGSRVATPEGGYFLWIELPEQVDVLEVHRRAIEAHISIAPGPMFSARRQFRNCLRLNYGHPWTAQVEDAVAELGRIIRGLT